MEALEELEALKTRLKWLRRGLLLSFVPQLILAAAVIEPRLPGHRIGDSVLELPGLVITGENGMPGVILRAHSVNINSPYGVPSARLSASGLGASLVLGAKFQYRVHLSGGDILAQIDTWEPQP